jgi:putative FmdB family regulatory protein
MPAYDFRCKSCSHTFEVTRPVSETSVPACPVCGGECKRMFTPVGIHFKGSGFHNTDYRKAAEKPADSGPEKAEPACPAAKDGGCAGCPAAE